MRLLLLLLLPFNALDTRPLDGELTELLVLRVFFFDPLPVEVDGDTMAEPAFALGARCPPTGVFRAEPGVPGLPLPPGRVGVDVPVPFMMAVFDLLPVPLPAPLAGRVGAGEELGRTFFGGDPPPVSLFRFAPWWWKLKELGWSKHANTNYHTPFSLSQERCKQSPLS